jgi:hypothetical protein
VLNDANRHAGNLGTCNANRCARSWRFTIDSKSNC